MLKDLTITRGTTFSYPIRWETDPIVYKPISGITNAAPCRVTCTSHGAPAGWRVAVISVKGMTELNSPNFPPQDSDFRIATVVDANTVEFNETNSADYKSYASGGYIMYYTPKDMAGYTARMSIKDKVGGTELLSLTTANNGIVIDNAGRGIALAISATGTSAITWKKGVYGLEMVSPTGEVTLLLEGKVTVVQEVTT